MREKGLILFLCFFSSLWGVQMGSISLFQWERIGEYEVSNLILSERGDLSLAPAIVPVFSAGRPIWSAVGWRNMLVVGTAEEASLFWIEGKKASEQPFPDHKIISALAADDDYLYVGAVPESTVYVMNMKREIVRKYVFTCSYIWSIVPSSQGIWILTGEPAEVYLLRGGNLQKVASLSSERHLLKGVLGGDTLYIMGESSLVYAVGPQRFQVVAQFSDPIQDIAWDGSALFVALNRIFLRNRRQNGETESQEALVYRYTPDGFSSRMISIPGTRLSQIFFWQNRIWIGSGQNFFVYDVGIQTLSVMGYGKGGVRFFAVAGDRLYIIADRGGNVFQLDVVQAKEGSLLSCVFDAGQKALWGRLIGEEGLVGATLWSRSSIATLPDLWEPWMPYGKKGVASSANRYIQIGLSLSTPVSLSLGQMRLSYVQLNQAPEITQFDVRQGGDKLLFSWAVQDPNQDDMRYTLSVIRERGNVTLFSSPLTNTSLEISSRFLPEGVYRFEILVTDDPSNTSSTSLWSSRRSGLLMIDHTLPQIKNMKVTLIQKNLQCQWVVSDNREITRVWYSVEPGEWNEVFPVDGIYDSLEERFELFLTNFKGGYVQIQARDISGNETVYGQWVVP